MEDQEKTPQETPTTRTQPVVVHKSNNAPLVGAIIFLALVIGAAAFYLGTQKKEPTAQIVPTPTIADNKTQTPTVEPTKALEDLNWEIYDNTKMKDLSFPAYSISAPFEWKKESKRDDLTDTLTLTKGAYAIKIYQAPMGGGMCIFEGELPEGPASDYRTSKYVDIKVGTLTIRRVEIKGGYAFCSNSANNLSSFGTPSTFGSISYTTPANPDPDTILEMDKIIASLKSL